jgi:hypothetical protein
VKLRLTGRVADKRQVPDSEGLAVRKAQGYLALSRWYNALRRSEGWSNPRDWSILMHGVAPHMCGRGASRLLDRGAGGRSPRLPNYWIHFLVTECRPLPANPLHLLGKYEPAARHFLECFLY